TADSLLMQMSTSISSFGIDRDQELYVVTYSSSGSATGIYRFSGRLVPGIPRSFALHQNRPNPFSEATSIPFGLKHSAAVSIRIFDAAGRLVRTLVNGERPAGTYRETWDGMDSSGTAAASGIYFCRFDAGGYRRTIKIVLLR
ncbi:MAG TPA: FlgD immunoglobulin-like domain containing protein, partial [Candidatus Krumholzibacteriaceae bacterium]